eukprot:TRINITY_DN27244_c0_g2_i1.p1 TRINITY_DN27244_c0_g2~~TRINITY_DN27244_c0_g2_i1.p1  ORF type:complete len:380 (-),score=68.31 TRINITY_DN27244_c0_g2_i1:381-1520(-)
MVHTIPAMEASSEDPNIECGYGAGDSFLVRNVLQGEDASITIDDVLEEVKLGALFHDNGQILNRPGAFVVAPVEGSSPSTKPYLRCPSSVGVVPSSEGPIMRKLRLAASRVAGVDFNHAKVQLYETRANHIAFHADKVLDLCEEDAFVSFRLGATRTFGLRSKANPRQLRNDIRATNNSAVVIGPLTNRGWTHGVVSDNRDAHECLPDELAYGERSLSIVFRRAVTFWRGDGFLFGGGARFKTEAALDLALTSAELQGKGREAVVSLGTKEKDLHKQILAAWGSDNKKWTVNRTELYAAIIEKSVLCKRTPAMDAEAEARTKARLVASAPDGTEQTKPVAAARWFSWSRLPWALLSGLTALGFGFVAANAAAVPSSSQI